MKMVVAIVHPEDAGALVDALTDKDFRVTRLHSQGGFLKQSHATILAGVEEAQVDDVIATIRETCHARSQFINPMPRSDVRWGDRVRLGCREVRANLGTSFTVDKALTVWEVMFG